MPTLPTRALAKGIVRQRKPPPLPGAATRRRSTDSSLIIDRRPASRPPIEPYSEFWDFPITAVPNKHWRPRSADEFPPTPWDELQRRYRLRQQGEAMARNAVRNANPSRLPSGGSLFPIPPQSPFNIPSIYTGTDLLPRGI
jgi:hypothetical protein